MNKILFLILSSVLLFSFTTLQAGKDDMIAALKGGDADGFVKYFDNIVDVKLPGGNEMKDVPKAQAASTVKSFFGTQAISSCTITSQRENAGTMYLTGKLNGTGNYNITAMIKVAGDKFSVITVRINN